MKKRREMTIRRELFLTALVFLLTISAAFITVLSATIYRLYMDGARERISGINRQIASYVEAHFEGLATTVNIMAANPDVIAGMAGSAVSRDRVLLYFRFVQMTNTNVKYCYSGYDTGELLINDYEPPPGFDPTVRPWYRSAEASFPEPSIGVPYQEIKDKEWLISVSKAFHDEATGRGGVVAIDSTLSRVDGMLNQVTSFESQTNIVVDRGGTVQIHPNPEYVGKSFTSIISDSSGPIDGNAGFLTYSVGRERRLAYFTAIRVADWILVSAVDREEVMRPIRFWIAVTVILVVFVSAGLGTAQVRVYERRFVRPVVDLKRRVSEITSGAEASKPAASYSNPELEAIAARIEEMTETSLSRQAHELALILESTSDGILVADDGLNIMHHNRRFRELWGFRGDERMHEGLDAVAGAMRARVDPKDAAAVLRMEDGDAPGKAPLPIRLENGTILEQDSRPLIEDGRVSGHLWSYKDVTSKILAEQKLWRMASTDDLTGLWNRRWFMSTAEYEVGQAARYRRLLSVAQLDVDHFKAINDRYGHFVGDDALRFLASSLKSLLRSTDTIGRTGGEEFTILLPNTDSAAALALAEKIRAFFAVHSFDRAGDPLGFTVSIGVATGRPGEAILEDLLNRADDACYAAKRAGRNRVEAADDPVGREPESGSKGFRPGSG